MKLEITETQAKNLMDLIDLWFYREIRENEDIDNTMWAWDILDVYKQCKELVDGCNTKARPRPEAIEPEDDFTVEKLLELHFKVETKSGGQKMMSYFNFKDPVDTFIEQERDENSNTTKLSFTTKCSGYNVCIT